jgi:hypothetical protein
MESVEKFTAGDADGNRYTIYVSQGKVAVSDIQPSAAASHDAPEELRTNDGRTVVRIHQGVYEILGRGDRIRVTTTDANAP